MGIFRRGNYCCDGVVVDAGCGLWVVCFVVSRRVKYVSVIIILTDDGILIKYVLYRLNGK
jgi:hypothetical protein